MSCSSIAQKSHPAIPIPQDRTLPILELVNLEENDTFLSAAINAHTTAVINMTILSPPLPRAEDVCVPPPSILFLPPQETNKILTNLVNFLRQQSDRLKRIDKNQVKIPVKIDTRRESDSRHKHRETTVAINDTTSVPKNTHKGN